MKSFFCLDVYGEEVNIYGKWKLDVHSSWWVGKSRFITQFYLEYAPTHVWFANH